MRKILTILLIFTGSILMAQEHGHEATSHESSEPHSFHHGRNFFMVEYAYTHIAEAVDHNNVMEKEGHWVSSFGLDYFRLVSERWRIGLKLDYELGHYIIPKKNNLKRENVFIVTPVAGFTILPKWSMYAGPGVEFEESKNLFIMKVGTDYAIELGKGWEIPIGAFVDFKEGYNTYAFTAGLGKFF